MKPDPPLLLRRAVWQIALVVTLILVAIRAGLYVRDRKRAAALEAEQARIAAEGSQDADVELTGEAQADTVGSDESKRDESVAGGA